MSSVNSFDVYSQLETLANQGGQNQTQDGIGLTYNSSVGGTGVGNGGGGGGTGPGGSNGGGGNGNGDDMDSGRWMYGAPRGSVDNVFAGTSGNSYFLAQSAAAANAENEDAIVCGSQCSACERCVNYCDNDQEGARPFNLHIKFICLLLIVYAGFVVATGRGIFSILQGIGGVIFAIEGLWNSVRFSPPGIRKFIAFLLLYVVASTAIGIVHVNTVAFYCASAETLQESRNCKDTTTLYSWLTFIGAVTIIPLIIVVFVVYYRTVIRYLNRLEKRADGQKKIALIRGHAI